VAALIVAGVTGASGFVGRHLIARLLDTGATVRRIALPHLPCNPHDLELRLRQELMGTEAVVHLTARVHHPEDAPDDPRPYEWANVELTRIAVRAAAAARVRTFVFASSVKAVGEESTERWTEATIPRPMGAYGKSKLTAEGIVAEEGQALGLRTLILRFPVIYGPGMRANMLRLFQAVHRGLPLPIGSAHQRRSLLFVGNAVAAIEAALQDSGPGSGLFFVKDGEDVTPGELIRAIAASLGRPARLIRVPPILLKASGRLGDQVSRVIPTPINSRMIARLTESLQVDDTLIRQQLGYRPPYTMAEGLAQTAEWFQSLENSSKARS